MSSLDNHHEWNTQKISTERSSGKNRILTILLFLFFPHRMAFPGKWYYRRLIMKLPWKNRGNCLISVFLSYPYMKFADLYDREQDKQKYHSFCGNFFDCRTCRNLTIAKLAASLWKLRERIKLYYIIEGRIAARYEKFDVKEHIFYYCIIFAWNDRCYRTAMFLAFLRLVNSYERFSETKKMDWEARQLPLVYDDALRFS